MSSMIGFSTFRLMMSFNIPHAKEGQLQETKAMPTFRVTCMRIGSNRGLPFFGTRGHNMSYLSPILQVFVCDHRACHAMLMLEPYCVCVFQFQSDSLVDG